MILSLLKSKTNIERRLKCVLRTSSWPLPGEKIFKDLNYGSSWGISEQFWEKRGIGFLKSCEKSDQMILSELDVEKEKEFGRHYPWTDGSTYSENWLVLVETIYFCLVQNATGYHPRPVLSARAVEASINLHLSQKHWYLMKKSAKLDSLL